MVSFCLSLFLCLLGAFGPCSCQHRIALQVPALGLDLQLEEFLATPEAANCTKCAFVVPTYEIKVDTQDPRYD